MTLLIFKMHQRSYYVWSSKAERQPTQISLVWVPILDTLQDVQPFFCPPLSGTRALCIVFMVRKFSKLDATSGKPSHYESLYQETRLARVPSYTFWHLELLFLNKKFHLKKKFFFFQLDLNGFPGTAFHGKTPNKKAWGLYNYKDTILRKTRQKY